MGEINIEKRDGSRNSRPMEEPDVGNPVTNLWEIPGGDKDLSSGSNGWASQNYRERENEWLDWDTQHMQFYQEYSNKNWHRTSNFDYSEKRHGRNMNPKAHGGMNQKYLPGEQKRKIAMD